MSHIDDTTGGTLLRLQNAQLLTQQYGIATTNSCLLCVEILVVRAVTEVEEVAYGSIALEHALRIRSST